ncbi:isoprenyl transferase [Culicoidibacter larvae]|uniref:Isoprenyl transferase n=1 Tax=Culicoidibacter larvae TaxID=2579976 RepID=A0A5R8QEQ2_9FIRM|nr:isoprenyl transferase [Culicoidibacter larvae]TLG76509.1 isoprenyl transferase [Culicoidibacter larvae]
MNNISELKDIIMSGNVPNHVALIMDGNGRWAKKRFLPRTAGHKKGVDTVEEIIEAASDIGIKYITLYAFSTENWKRPEEEVNYLMSLPRAFFDYFLPKLMKNNVKIKCIGRWDLLPEDTRKAVADAINDTKDNSGLTVNFALNYGGRDEIVYAVEQIAKLLKDNPDLPISEDLIGSHLFNPDAQDADFVIRTSGEYRISNFLLWQSAYAEYYFTDTLWPDFKTAEFYQSIIDFQNRDRRRGGIK